MPNSTQDSKTDKFVSMIGFAKRSAKIVYGYDSLSTARGIKLLAVSDSASDNLLNSMERLAEKRNIPLVYAPKLDKKTAQGNVKALGLTDANMANAITDYIADGTTEYKIRFGLRR